MSRLVDTLINGTWNVDRETEKLRPFPCDFSHFSLALSFASLFVCLFVESQVFKPTALDLYSHPR